jgi:hypothetical protein
MAIMDSNKSRGLRKKAGTDDDVPALIDSDISPKAFRKNWARPDYLIDADRSTQRLSTGYPIETYI